jgi:hypothetical protein
MLGLILSCYLGISVTHPSVAIVPPASQDKAQQWIALVIAENLENRLLVKSRLDPATMERIYPLNIFGWRQTQAAARAEGISTRRPLSSSTAKKLTKQLGASMAFVGQYKVNEKHVTLNWRLVGAKNPQDYQTKLNMDNLALGLGEIARQIFTSLEIKEVGYITIPIPKLSAIEWQDYGRALKLLARQSLDPRAHLVLPTNELDTIIGALGKLLQTSPKFSRAAVLQAMTLLMRGETQTGQEQLLGTLSGVRHPGPTGALGLYHLYGRQNQPALAIKALRVACDNYPGFLLGLGYLGRAYGREKDYAKALKVFENYSQKVPQNAWAKLQQAHYLSLLGKYETALQITLNLRQEFPGSIQIMEALAKLYIQQEDYRKARQILERGLKGRTTHPALLTHLSFVALQENKLEEALDLAQKAAEAIGHGRGEPLAGYAHLNLAHALALNTRHKKALATLQYAIYLGIGQEAKERFLSDPRLVEFINAPNVPKF